MYTKDLEYGIALKMTSKLKRASSVLKNFKKWTSRKRFLNYSFIGHFIILRLRKKTVLLGMITKIKRVINIYKKKVIYL